METYEWGDRSLMTDWLMVIITAIYVVATIIICYFNGKSAQAARIQTDEMMRQYNLANRLESQFILMSSDRGCYALLWRMKVQVPPIM